MKSRIEQQKKVYREMNKANADLLEFLCSHPSSRTKPWTNEESREYMRLLKKWRRLVSRLTKLQGGLYARQPSR